MKAKTQKVSKYTVRTTAGLCEALFDEFDMLRNGTSDGHRAASVAKMANQILASKRLEMDAASMIKDGMRIRPVLLEQNRRLGIVR
jgi:hypothetical protein